MNTIYKQPPKCLYIQTAPDGYHHNQIDFIMIEKRWKSSFQWVKFKLKASKIKLEKLVWLDTQNIPETYTADVSNHFKTLLQSYSQTKTAEEMWKDA